jgi:hypothetical protein
MFKTGSRFLFGLSAFGFVAAIVYAAATGDHKIGMDSFLGPITGGYKGYVGDHAGYSALIGLSAVSLFAGIFLSSLRDADPEAAARALGLETVPEVPAPARVNYWPVVGAFSLGAVALGLAIGPAMFIIGCIGLVITGVEWAVRTWADRATGDPEVNQTIRDRFLRPVEVPGLAVIGIAGLVLAVSRILLALPKEGSYVVFGLVPAIILGLGFLVAYRPNLSQSTIAAMLLVGAVALLGGGVAAAIAGEREHEGGHETDHGAEAEHDEGLAPLSFDIPVQAAD